MADEKALLQRIEELEEQLLAKSREAQRYREELVRANHALEKLISELSQELKWIAVIQKALSPTQLPNIPGFEFSSKFIAGLQHGGDYFDIFEHDDRLRFGILLSCASGYSTSALFLSVLLKISGRLEARKGISAQQALESLAAEMRPNMAQEKDEAQIFYGVVDRRTFEFRYSTYGEIAAIWQPQGTEKIVRLEPGASALTRDNFTKPLEQTIQLGPKDRLILCSRGVLMAQNAKGEAFGLERLHETVGRVPRANVHDVRNEILFRVEQFGEKNEPTRDLTVVVIEVNDRVIKLAK